MPLVDSESGAKVAARAVGPLRLGAIPAESPLGAFSGGWWPTERAQQLAGLAQHCRGVWQPVGGIGRDSSLSHTGATIQVRRVYWTGHIGASRPLSG